MANGSVRWRKRCLPIPVPDPVSKAQLSFQIDLVDLTERFGEDRLEKLIGISETALRAENALGVWAVSIVLTTDQHLQELHREYLDDDTPTDIMTFQLDDPLDPGSRGGEIVISIDRAAEQALEAGWPLEKELAFLVIHGMLHLLGWDDATESARTSMLARQTVILAEADKGQRWQHDRERGS